MDDKELPKAPDVPADADEKMAESGAGVEGPKPLRPLGGGKSGPAFENQSIFVVPSITDPTKKVVVNIPAKPK